jgi:hypothetical protein
MGIIGVKAGKIPLRRCTGCGQMLPKPGLIRVRRADDEVSIDLRNKQPGRGAYVCRNGECIAKAAKSRGIERTLKGAVSKDIYEELKKIPGEQDG